MKRLIALAALALAACDPAVPVETAHAPEAAAPEAAAPAAAPTPAQPSGPPATIDALSEADDAAWVTDVVVLDQGDAKIYSTAGGDPAINGLYTYLAVIDNVADGWRVFQIGDFNSWKVIEQSSGRVVLSVSRSFLDNAGEIKTVEEKLIVAVPAFAETKTTITPAS